MDAVQAIVCVYIYTHILEPAQETHFLFVNPIPKSSQKLELTERTQGKWQTYYSSVFILLKIGSLRTC